MSALTEFAKKAFLSARTTIGGESITINGGASVSAVLNEIGDSQSYEDAGFSPVTSFQAVIESTEFTTAYTANIRSYIGASVASRSRTFRLTDITSGRSFITLKLETISRA